MNNKSIKINRKFVPGMEEVLNENFTYEIKPKNEYVLSLNEFLNKSTNIINEALRPLPEKKSTCGKFNELLTAIREAAPRDDEDIQDDIKSLTNFYRKHCHDEKTPVASERKVRSINDLAIELGIIKSKENKESTESEEPTKKEEKKTKKEKIGGKRGSPDELIGPSDINYEILGNTIRDEITAQHEKGELQQQLQKSGQKGVSAIENIKSEIINTLQSTQQIGILHHSPFSGNVGTREGRKYESPKFGKVRKPNIKFKNSGEVQGVQLEEINIGFQPNAGLPQRVVVYSYSPDDLYFNIGEVITNDPVDLYQYTASGKLKNPKFSKWKIELTLIEKFSTNPDDIIIQKKIDDRKNEIYQKYVESMNGRTPRSKESMNIQYMPTISQLFKTAYDDYFKNIGSLSGNKMKPDKKRAITKGFINGYVEKLKKAINNYDFNDDVAKDFSIAFSALNAITKPYKKAGNKLIVPEESKNLGRNYIEDSLLVDIYKIFLRIEELIMKELKKSKDKKAQIDLLSDYYDTGLEYTIQGPIVLIFDVLVSMRNDEFSNLNSANIKYRKKLEKYEQLLDSDVDLSPEEQYTIEDSIKVLKHNIKAIERQIRSGKPVENISDIQDYLNPAQVQEETQNKEHVNIPTFWVEKKFTNEKGEEQTVLIPTNVKDWLEEKHGDKQDVNSNKNKKENKSKTKLENYTFNSLKKLSVDELMKIAKNVPDLEEKIETNELKPEEIINEILKYQDDETQEETQPSQDEMNKEAQEAAKKGENIPEDIQDDEDDEDDIKTPNSAQKKKRVISGFSLRTDPSRFKPVNKKEDDKEDDKDEKENDDKEETKKEEKEEKVLS